MVVNHLSRTWLQRLLLQLWGLWRLKTSWRYWCFQTFASASRYLNRQCLRLNSWISGFFHLLLFWICFWYFGGCNSSSCWIQEWFDSTFWRNLVSFATIFVNKPLSLRHILFFWSWNWNSSSLASSTLHRLEYFQIRYFTIPIFTYDHLNFWHGSIFCICCASAVAWNYFYRYPYFVAF